MSDLLSKYASQQAETDISRRSLNLSSTTIHELTQLIPQFAQNKSVKTTRMTIQVLVHNLRHNQSTIYQPQIYRDRQDLCTINCVVHIAGSQRQSRSFEGALFTGIGMCTQTTHAQHEVTDPSTPDKQVTDCLSRAQLQ